MTPYFNEQAPSRSYAARLQQRQISLEISKKIETKTPLKENSPCNYEELAPLSCESSVSDLHNELLSEERKVSCPMFIKQKTPSKSLVLEREKSNVKERELSIWRANRRLSEKFKDFSQENKSFEDNERMSLILSEINELKSKLSAIEKMVLGVLNISV